MCTVFMIYATFCKSLMRIQDIKNNLEAAWPRLISLSKAPVPTIVRPLLARAVAYKLSLVWMSNKLTNEEPQEFHWPSHQASWMPGVSGSNNIASLLSQQLFTGEYKEFDSRPPCFYRLSKVNPMQSLIHFEWCIAGIISHKDNRGPLRL